MSSNTTTKKSLDSMKDVKSLDEIDFDNLEFQRGKTPEDIKQKCLKLCKEYLSGNWLEQTLDTIEVRRVSGGLTNQLYYCGIATPSDTSAVPQEVAIRLYGAKHLNKSGGETNERLTDVVTALLVSESGLGPKVYGIFEEGQIQHFYKHRQFKVEEQKDPELVAEVFQKLARIHAMEAPLKKTHWLFHEYDIFYKDYETHLDNGLREVIDQAQCQTLLTHDMKSELQWIKEMIVKSGSPLVFCHNDFRSSNIMVLEDRENNNINVDEKLVVCDYEYSSYGYRGQDFGSIICEWGRSWNDMKDLHVFPNDSTLRQLIQIYVEESKRILGQNFLDSEINSVDHILQEVKLFSLSMSFFIVIWCLRDDKSFEETFPMDKKVTVQLAEIGYRNYWHLKQQFIKENAFDF